MIHFTIKAGGPIAFETDIIHAHGCVLGQQVTFTAYEPVGELMLLRAFAAAFAGVPEEALLEEIRAARFTVVDGEGEISVSRARESKEERP